MEVIFISNHDKIPGEKIGFNHPLYQIEEFLKLGYKVTYIVPSFNHFNKSQRIYNESVYDENERLRIVVLKALAYDKNIGIKRFLSHFLFSVSVFKYVFKFKKVDIIFLVLPSPFLDIVCVLLKKIFKSKLYVDFRDLWPELFEVYLKGVMRILAWPFIQVLYFNRKIAFKNASIITAVSNTYLKIAEKSNPDARSEVIYLGYADEFSGKKSIKLKTAEGALNVIYAGSLSYNYDIKCLLSVVELIDKNYPQHKINFHIAGSGVFEKEVEKCSSIYNNRLRFYGKLDAIALNELYLLCDISLCIYDSKTLISFPAKIFELIFKELPIINSLKGEVGELIEKQRLGLNYVSGDVNSLFTQILTIYHDNELLDEFKNNMNECKGSYSKDNQYSKFNQLIKNI
jgi:glycosyltransferase involved in cell wall biosynthesis